ncbi:MAG: hypothetical protein ABIY70_17805 [Capsulimonas sp.]|uniref:hypothetical protein n=1 Tax=Capsulimonas sp. TaxID=2494211 RepID=UPI0032672334
MNPLLYRFLRPKPPNVPPSTPEEPHGCGRAFWIGMLFFALVFGFLFWYFEVR